MEVPEMTININGPGKYDDICTEVAKRVGISSDTGGGVIVIVLGGNLGNGFSVQADLATAMQIPDLLRFCANQIEYD
jgi:hypothetical protein